MNKKQKQAIDKANKLRLSADSADAYVGELLFEYLDIADDDINFDMFHIDRSGDGTLYLIIEQKQGTIEVPVDVLFADKYKGCGSHILLKNHVITFFN